MALTVGTGPTNEFSYGGRGACTGCQTVHRGSVAKTWQVGLRTLPSSHSNEPKMPVVWKYNGKADQTYIRENWSRAAILRGGPNAERLPIIPVVLHQNHYFALRLPKLRKTFPKEWAEDHDEQIQASQDIGDGCRLELSRDVRGSGNSSVEDSSFDVDELLATCSIKSEKDSGMKQVDNISALLKPCSSFKDEMETAEDLDFDEQKEIQRVQRLKKHWDCPICALHFDLPVGPSIRHTAICKISHHMRTKHTSVWKRQVEKMELWRSKRGASCFGVSQMIQSAPFLEIPKHRWISEVRFPCPYCDKVLPEFVSGALTKRMENIALLSKRYHIQMECKGCPADVPLKKCWKDAKIKHQWFFEQKAAERVRKAQFDIAKENGHDPVDLPIPFSQEETHW